MKRGIVAVLLLFSLLVIATAQDAMPGVEKVEVNPLLDAEPVEKAAPKKVTMVYGVSADDYLPQNAKKQYNYRPKIRRAKSRPAFDMPESFYLFGGLALISILIFTIVSFIRDFEDAQREKVRQVASERFNPE